MRGEQGMHELNTAKEYETVKEEIGTKVCVQFRTSEVIAASLALTGYVLQTQRELEI